MFSVYDKSISNYRFVRSGESKRNFLISIFKILLESSLVGTLGIVEMFCSHLKELGFKHVVLKKLRHCPGEK